MSGTVHNNIFYFHVEEYTSLNFSLQIFQVTSKSQAELPHIDKLLIDTRANECPIFP